MIKKLFFTFLINFFLITSAFSAGSSDSSSSKTKTNYDKAVSHIKIAKNYEKKGKTEKSRLLRSEKNWMAQICCN